MLLDLWGNFFVTPITPIFGLVSVSDVSNGSVTVEDAGMGIYDIGSEARLLGTFVDINGNPADPTDVSVIVRAPDGSTDTFTPVRDSVGSYHYDLDLDDVGFYYYRYAGTGALVAAGDGYLQVNNSVTLEPNPPINSTCC